MRREFADVRGRSKVFVGEVYDFKDPYWRVRYQDGDWEELNRQYVKLRRSWRQLQLQPGAQDGPDEWKQELAISAETVFKRRVWLRSSADRRGSILLSSD